MIDIFAPGALTAYIFSAVFGLVAVGAWLWMARKIKRGQGGARVMAGTLFAINTLAVYGSAGVISNHFSFLLGLAEWGAGLLTVVFLWDHRSSLFFYQVKLARSFAQPQWPTRATAPPLTTLRP